MRLARHLLGYLPVQLASAIASFGGVYAFTRLLTPEDYGRYALMFSALALLQTVTLLWVEAAAYRFAGAAGEGQGRADHRVTALTLMRRSLVVAMAAWAVLALLLHDVAGYGVILPWIAVLLPACTLLQIALEMHRADLRVRRYAAVRVATTLSGFAMAVLLAAFTGLGAVAPFAGLAAATVIAAVLEGRALRRAARGGAMTAGAARAWLGYGAPLAIALALDLVLSASDRLLIALFLGEASVGAYAAGYGVADKTVLLICAWAASAASPLLMAAYERGGPEATRESGAAFLRTLMHVALPATVGLALVAGPLSQAMIGEAVRAEAARIIPWIAFAGLMNGLLVHYASEPYHLARRTGLRAALMAVPAALNIALNLVLLPALGLMGAVYATVASYAAGLVLLILVGRRLVPLPVPAGAILRPAIAALAMVPAVRLVPDWGSWPQLFASALVGALVYAGVLILLDPRRSLAFLHAMRGKSDAPRTA